MNLEEALKTELSLISGLENKIYPLNAPEGIKTPYIVYVSSEGIRDKCLQGYLTSKEVNCEINILSDSYRSLKDITKQVLSKLISFQGRNIGENGPFIQDVSYENPDEVYEDELLLYLCAIDLTVTFKE